MRGDPRLKCTTSLTGANVSAVLFHLLTPCSCAGRNARYRSNRAPTFNVSLLFTRQMSLAYAEYVYKPFNDADGESIKYTSSGLPLFSMCTTSPEYPSSQYSLTTSRNQSPPNLKLWLPARPSLK